MHVTKASSTDSPPLQDTPQVDKYQLRTSPPLHYPSGHGRVDQVPPSSPLPVARVYDSTVGKNRYGQPAARSTSPAARVSRLQTGLEAKLFTEGGYLE